MLAEDLDRYLSSTFRFCENILIEFGVALKAHVEGYLEKVSYHNWMTTI